MGASFYIDTSGELEFTPGPPRRRPTEPWTAETRRHRASRTLYGARSEPAPRDFTGFGPRRTRMVRS